MADFYFGQSVNSLSQRNNGHRSGFKITEKDKSALSMHVYDKHTDVFGDKLDSYEFGVVKHADPTNLDRVEDYYIYNTEADVKGLNRYKVIS